MAFWTYILRCADGNYYTGHTDDLERRIGEHHHGGLCNFTSRRRPVQLIWAGDFPTRIEALEIEMRLKKWSRAKTEALANGDWKRLSFFARPPRERVSTAGQTTAARPEPAEGLDTNGGRDSGISDRRADLAQRPRERVSTSLDTNGGVLTGAQDHSETRSCRAEARQGRSRDTQQDFGQGRDTTC